MLFSWLAAIAKAVNNKCKQIDQENIISFIIIPYIIVYYIKVMTFGCFCGKFADEGDDSMDNQNIYKVEGDNICSTVYNMLSSVYNPWQPEDIWNYLLQKCNFCHAQYSHDQPLRYNGSLNHLQATFTVNPINTNPVSVQQLPVFSSHPYMGLHTSTCTYSHEDYACPPESYGIQSTWQHATITRYTRLHCYITYFPVQIWRS